MDDIKLKKFENVDRLLESARQGDPEAMKLVWEQMWPEFRIVARALLRDEQHRTRFGTTGSGLVSELWMRIVPNIDSVATARGLLEYGRQAMRNILVDYARERKATKRDGGVGVPIESPFMQKMEARLASAGISAEDALANVIDAIERMSAIDAELGKIVELVYIYGYSQEEGALIMKMPRSSYGRRLAQAVGELKRILKIVALEETPSKTAAAAK